ncbi:UPF0488 protein CG14286-like [Centruroides sculpturatus]|uniref:UPF0488 protein CG14286-like n=1 Tax=Centruroides sculpturatus TaxID=218467 RepID=UPI000C6D43C9|nr:UPF0488 protein CG14286-like [Centruroides sculpturatus]
MTASTSNKSKTKKLPPQIIQNETSDQDTTTDFETELLWCIEQLQISLSSDKLNSRQTEDSMKILKVLRNPKAPHVKKRQVMRQAFGDYRSKMKSEEKQFKLDKSKMKISACKDELGSKFLRKHVKKSEEETSSYFKFNFPTPNNESNFLNFE